MMDVRKMEPQNWLTVDQNYIAEHRVRSQLLRHEKSRVLQCLPESYEACMEMLEEAVEFLCQRFPGLFERMQNGNGNGSRVWNKLTGESFVYGTGHDELDPLEIAVRLSMEDLSVLMKNADNEYYLCVRTYPKEGENINTIQSSQRKSLPRWMDSRRTHRMDNLQTARPGSSLASTGSQLRQQVSTMPPAYRLNQTDQQPPDSSLV